MKKNRLPGIKTVIGVANGKGGVGKTFVAVNLALTFAKLGKKVGLLDADITCPNVFKTLGITQKITPTADNKIVPVQKYGISVVSMAGLTASEEEPLAWRGTIISKILQQFLKETLWGELDILLVDFPPGTSDIALTLMQNFELDGIIVVTTPQSLALTDARRTLQMASLLNVPVLGIVENMRGDIFGERGGSVLGEMYRAPLLGSIPLRKQILTLTDQGVPPVFHMEELEMIFSKIARYTIEKVIA